MEQNASEIIMLRPQAFAPNPETANDNAFQEQAQPACISEQEKNRNAGE